MSYIEELADMSYIEEYCLQTKIHHLVCHSPDMKAHTSNEFSFKSSNIIHSLIFRVRQDLFTFY